MMEKLPEEHAHDRRELKKLVCEQALGEMEFSDYE